MDDLTSVTNPDGDITTYTYDGVGNKTVGDRRQRAHHRLRLRREPTT